MAGPWEKYQQAAPAQEEAGPWAKYAAEAPVDSRIMDANDARAMRPAAQNTPPAPAKPTLEQLRLASPVTRLLETGPGDMVMGAGQFLAHLASPISDAPAKWIDTKMAERNAQTAEAMRATGRDPEGVDIPRLVGQGAVGAAMLPMRASAPTMLGRAVQSAGAGAAAGAISPAQGGEGYLPEKTAQVVGGAALGGVLSPVAEVAATGAAKAINATSNALRQSRGQTLSPMQIEIKLAQALDGEGIDWKSLSGEVRKALVDRTSKALSTGGTVNPAELARLADFESIGVQPMRSWITRDPGEFTVTDNLRRMQAADGGGRLVDAARAANQRFSGVLNDLGAGSAAGPVATGERVIGSVKTTADMRKNAVGRAYGVAERLNAGDIPLEASPGISSAFQKLDYEGKLGFLPGQARTVLNQIQSGELPLTVGRAEGIKTMLSAEMRKAERAGDGNAAYALRHAYDAIENAQPAAPLGADAQAAFRDARTLAAQNFGWRDSSRGVKAALDDAAPDNFIERNVLSKSASAADVKGLLQSIGMSDKEALKREVVAWLQGKAAPNVGIDAEAAFSQAAFNKALRDIGDDKLALIFSPQEFAQLKALGRASYNAVSQPAASSVNNSNTATTGAAGLMKLADLLGGVPVVGPMMGSLGRRKLIDAVTVMGPPVPSGAVPGAAISAPTLRDLVRLLPQGAAPGLVVSAQPGKN